MHLDTISVNLVSIRILIMKNDSRNSEAVLERSVELWIFGSVSSRLHCNGVPYEHA